MSQRKDETKEEYNARMNAMMKVRYAKRRTEEVERMGGRCIDCQTTQMLEFDHIDPSEKEHNVSHIMMLSIERVRTELDKCVLRCVACHGHQTALQKLQGVNLLPL